jgi:hypothetical protein
LTLETGFLFFAKFNGAGVTELGIVEVVGLGDAPGVKGLEGDAATDVTDTVVLDGRPEVVKALTRS